MGTDPPPALCIARFAVPDQAAVDSLRAALAATRRCLVVLRDAYQARSARCPFTWQERAGMLQAALPAQDATRATFVPLRERYDENRTVDDLRELQSGGDPGALASNLAVYWCGERDPRLERAIATHTNWTVTDTPASADPRQIQDRLFAAAEASGAAEALGELLAEPVRAALPSWLAAIDYVSLRAEHEQLRREQKQWSAVPYPVTLVTVDAVLRARDQVLLIRRGRAPGKGLRAVPGGFLEPGDTVYDSAVRELQEETQIALSADDARPLLRGVQVFDHPRRSQRGRVITHAHYFDLGDRALPEVQGGDDAAAAEWVPISRLASMEAEFLDDHFEILSHFLGRTSQEDRQEAGKKQSR